MDTSPTRHIPDGHFPDQTKMPDGHFHDQAHPRRTLSRPDKCPTDISHLAAQ